MKYGCSGKQTAGRTIKLIWTNNVPKRGSINGLQIFQNFLVQVEQHMRFIRTVCRTLD